MRFDSIMWRMAVATLALLSSVAAFAEQPMFETGTLSVSAPQGFVLNVCPLTARLSSGRLLCAFSAETAANPPKLKVAARVTYDGGKSWSQAAILFDHPKTEEADPNLLVDGDRVPIFSTTVPEPTGTLVIGYAWDPWAERGTPPASEGEMDIKLGLLRSVDRGKTWSPGGDLYAEIPKASPHSVSGLDEPATVVPADGRVMSLMRTSGSKLRQSWSSDGGQSWEPPQASVVTAHNSRAALWELGGSSEVPAAWDNFPAGRRTFQ